jgi:flagellar FliL protein
MSDEKTAAPPKKSRKGLIIAILGVVVLGGGGAGAYFAFAGGGKKPDAKEAEKAKAAVKLPAQFVDMDPPFVVNFEPGSNARFLQVTVQLMTREPEMVEFLGHNKPIVRNDLLLLFGNKHVEEVATQEGKEALRTAALAGVRKIIKEEGGKPEALEAVYFTSFVMQ